MGNSSSSKFTESKYSPLPFVPEAFIGPLRQTFAPFVVSQLALFPLNRYVCLKQTQKYVDNGYTPTSLFMRSEEGSAATGKPSHGGWLKGGYGALRVLPVLAGMLTAV